MSFIVIYDANVLYPNTLRDLLIRIAQQPHLVQAKWTSKILDEMLSALRRNRPDIGQEKAERLRERMNAAVRDCLVEGYEPLIDILDLPDPGDRHVLAAAIKVNAQLIVTRNRKDFPPKILAEWGVRPKAPDDFVRDVLDLDPQAVWACIQQIVDSRTRHPVTTADVLDEPRSWPGHLRDRSENIGHSGVWEAVTRQLPAWCRSAVRGRWCGYAW